MEIAILALAAIGHVTLWVTVNNRVHALGIPGWAIGLLTAFSAGCLLGIPVGITWTLALSAKVGTLADDWTRIASLYLVACCGVAVVGLLGRIFQVVRHRRSPVPRSDRVDAVRVLELLHHRPVRSRVVRWLTQLPGNQVFDLAIHEKAIPLEHLDPALDGFSIAHLSDLHMSGRIDKEYFQLVVERTNALRPDLIAITGDLFDARECLDWIADTLGRLQAPCGVYYILGNHDLRVDRYAPRRWLAEHGLIDLGGRWTTLSVADRPIVLAGNELPWYAPAADMEHAPRKIKGRTPLRILLSHAPDQIDWARNFAFDLMLAGHTHGGQIRFPWIGSIVSPSRLGTKYAAGTYRLPPTVMHVSRGISSLTPVRWNCPPELSVLRLCRAAVPERRGERAEGTELQVESGEPVLAPVRRASKVSNHRQSRGYEEGP